MQAKKLYVGNLNYAVTEEQLRELFAGYGEVTEVKLIEGKGFAFVEMAQQADAVAARDELNGTDFGGRTLRVDEARPPKSKPRPFGGGGGGGYNRRY